MSKWTTYSLDDLTHIPKVAGCYAVYCNKKLIYVGQSTNVNKRIASYEFNYTRYSDSIHTPWGICKSLMIKIRKSVKYGDWAMIELRLIKRLKPRFNCVGSSKKRGEIFDIWSVIK
jgi:excinuclease UvrABC nuclease subunit